MEKILHQSEQGMLLVEATGRQIGLSLIALLH